MNGYGQATGQSWVVPSFGRFPRLPLFPHVTYIQYAFSCDEFPFLILTSHFIYLRWIIQ